MLDKLHNILDKLHNIIMVILIVACLIFALIFFGGMQILSFLGRILTSPIFWVLVGIIVVAAFWWHEKS